MAETPAAAAADLKDGPTEVKFLSCRGCRHEHLVEGALSVCHHPEVYKVIRKDGRDWIAPFELLLLHGKPPRTPLDKCPVLLDAATAAAKMTPDATPSPGGGNA
jgi:hypothetical protein